MMWIIAEKPGSVTNTVFRWQMFSACQRDLGFTGKLNRLKAFECLLWCPGKQYVSSLFFPEMAIKLCFPLLLKY